MNKAANTAKTETGIPLTARPAPALSSSGWKKLLADGLWSNNPALIQLLGLCPLLAVSNTAINGLSLGIATAFTVLLSNLCVSACRGFILPDIRIPVYVIIISGIVTVVGLLMNAYAHTMHLRLGIFIPLIITNCAILARAEAFASRNNVIDSALDGLATGAGFALVLFVLGSLRELLGHGTLLADAHLLLGTEPVAPLIELGENYRGLLIAILPPGAFILFGLLLALNNCIRNSNHSHSTRQDAGVPESGKPEQKTPRN